MLGKNASVKDSGKNLDLVNIIIGHPSEEIVNHVRELYPYEQCLSMVKNPDLSRNDYTFYTLMLTYLYLDRPFEHQCQTFIYWEKEGRFYHHLFKPDSYIISHEEAEDLFKHTIARFSKQGDEKS